MHTSKWIVGIPNLLLFVITGNNLTYFLKIIVNSAFFFFCQNVHSFSCLLVSCPKCIVNKFTIQSGSRQEAQNFPNGLLEALARSTTACKLRFQNMHSTFWGHSTVIMAMCVSIYTLEGGTLFLKVTIFRKLPQNMSLA